MSQMHLSLESWSHNVAQIELNERSQFHYTVLIHSVFLNSEESDMSATELRK